MVRAAQLQESAYEEVERDVDATSQAALVVVAAAIAGGIGMFFSEQGGVRGLIFGVVTALISWIVWSVVTYFVGKHIFGTTNTNVSLGQMLRTLGFAQSPRLLNVFGFVPVLGGIIMLVTLIWTLITSIIAIRAAMDFSTGRAIATAVVGFIINLVIAAVVAIVLGVGGALTGGFS
jgi:hypothetical protein